MPSVGGASGAVPAGAAGVTVGGGSVPGSGVAEVVLGGAVCADEDGAAGAVVDGADEDGDWDGNWAEVDWGFAGSGDDCARLAKGAKTRVAVSASRMMRF